MQSCTEVRVRCITDYNTFERHRSPTSAKPYPRIPLIPPYSKRSSIVAKEVKLNKSRTCICNFPGLNWLQCLLITEVLPSCTYLRTRTFLRMSSSRFVQPKRPNRQRILRDTENRNVKFSMFKLFTYTRPTMCLTKLTLWISVKLKPFTNAHVGLRQ